MMNIKNKTKKLLASLLIATAFVPFGLKINEAFQNNFTTTFASPNYNIINHRDVDFVCLGNEVYVEKSLYDQNSNNYNSKAISQVFESAKNSVKEKVELDYNNSVPIYIVDNGSTKFLKKRNAAITYSKGNEQSIYIKNKHFFAKNSTTLAHEMIHAILCFELGKNYYNLPTWLNEGIATQADSKNYYGRDFSIKDLNRLLLSDKYPENNEENLKYYLIHQRLIKCWIDDQGVEVIAKFIDLVKSGKAPQDAFYSLGGENAINKLKSMAVKC